ncbi:MAG: tRNA (adenosine(37)-N6)-threonylcarbamoyltransferase complex dimerization subunit type 1 TsaB [Pseudomonadota bacterium]
MSTAGVNILALETATSACSVALVNEDRVFQREQIGNNIHSQVLLVMVQEVLQEAGISVADLDAVAAGQGPGSFTGLRIGVGVAQGLAYGAGCPMIGISSLDALAAQANSSGKLIAGIDARMGEIYWCVYTVKEDDIQRRSELQLSNPGDLCSVLQADEQRNVLLVGNAWAEYREALGDVLQRHEVLPDVLYPNATGVLQLAQAKYAVREWVSAPEFAPEYVRNNVAKKSVRPVKAE